MTVQKHEKMKFGKGWEGIPLEFFRILHIKSFLFHGNLYVLKGKTEESAGPHKQILYQIYDILVKKIVNYNSQLSTLLSPSRHFTTRSRIHNFLKCLVKTLQLFKHSHMKLIGVFLKWSKNLANSGNLINH